MERTQPKIVFEVMTERNRELYKYVMSGKTYSETADKFDISRARVGQLVKTFEKKLNKVA